ADGYGLGAAQVAPALAREGCRHFFVAHLDEAVRLRPYVPDAELFVLHGVPPGAEADCAAHGAIPVLNSLEQIEAWTALARNQSRVLPAIVQVDTGMSRLGLSSSELAAVAAQPRPLEGIVLRYVMSHLACAEQQGAALNPEQLRRFRKARAMLPDAPASFANSSGVFLGREYHFDLARPGAALYGVAPVAGQPNPMRPVIRLKGRIIQVREIGAGDAVGYGATWRADGPRRIATVSVGYADGFLRSLSNRGSGFAGDTEVPLVGIVSMDTVTFDVSEASLDALTPGGFIDLIDRRNPVDAVAGRASTIGYEILTSLGQRYFRRYVND
ncbi:MAG: alanine racemase, partial [Acetobacteraceae bacterium]|nr:alanine racemase [Acetobacteraceae bacterium]